MSTTITRRLALSVVSLGIVGGAALGLSGTANAAEVAPQPGIVAVPNTTAQPATNASPGYWWHRHHPSLLDPTTAANFIAPGA
jgi:hypothetical protein